MFLTNSPINYRLSIAGCIVFDVRVDPIGDGDIQGPPREAIDDVEGEGTGEDDLQKKKKKKKRKKKSVDTVQSELRCQVSDPESSQYFNKQHISLHRNTIGIIWLPPQLVKQLN